MNTTDTDSPATELAALWESLCRNQALCIPGLSANVTEPRLCRDESGWDHVEVRVTYEKTGKNASGAAVYLPTESFAWRMGLGLIDWAVPFKNAFAYGIGYQYRERGKTSRNLISRDQVDLVRSCPGILRLFAKTCNPAEVLARVCSDAKSAETPFGHWAAECGLSDDSIKALDTYMACQKQGIQARRLVDAKTFDKLAELANRL